ncbi:hypothetical protein OY671_009954, partial [Metschnikowia pulcherrima]
PDGKGGGAAGYRPRVRCAYCTPQFITIAGEPAPPHIGIARQMKRGAEAPLAVPDARARRKTGQTRFFSASRISASSSTSLGPAGAAGAAGSSGLANALFAAFTIRKITKARITKLTIWVTKSP